MGVWEDGTQRPQSGAAVGFSRVPGSSDMHARFWSTCGQLKRLTVPLRTAASACPEAGRFPVAGVNERRCKARGLGLGSRDDRCGQGSWRCDEGLGCRVHGSACDEMDHPV